MPEIGKRIKEIRIKRRLSQEDLAESAKINLRTIQRIENNETTPRGKTLKLIFDVLEIKVIDQEKKTINKYLIWSSFLTLIIIASSFIGWIEFTSTSGINFKKIGPEQFTINGWKGNISLNRKGFKFYNWLVSLCALSIGSISIISALEFIEKKKREILGQLIFILSYIIVLAKVSEQLTNSSKYFVFKPGLFIVIVATLLLTISYFKKGKKLLLTPCIINCLKSFSFGKNSWTSKACNY